MAPPSRIASILAALGSLCGLVTLASAAVPSPPAGTLTVVSRPSGAICRIRGDRILVGGTPLTLRGVYPGKYSVRAIDPAYERWQRTVSVDGARNDTVWMSLRERTTGRATLRSLSLPGWGQFYSSRPVPGWIYATSAAALFGGSIAAQVSYVDRGNEVERAQTLEEWERSVHKMDDARRLRNALQVALVGVWGINVIDAAVFHHRSSGARAGLEMASAGGPESVQITATIRF